MMGHPWIGHGNRHCSLFVIAYSNYKITSNSTSVVLHHYYSSHSLKYYCRCKREKRSGMNVTKKWFHFTVVAYYYIPPLLGIIDCDNAHDHLHRFNKFGTCQLC